MTLTIEQAEMVLNNAVNTHPELQPVLNFDCQVRNGGVQQWEDNGYLRTEGESLAQFLHEFEERGIREGYSTVLSALNLGKRFRDLIESFHSDPYEIEFVEDEMDTIDQIYYFSREYFIIDLASKFI